jgi:Holliday junction DNA helicase RuvA
LHVREDNLTLFGFSTAREMALFETLITVKGIGPKLGLALLSGMDADQLTMAIASGDSSLLTGIPGVGKKTAERIVLELKDKIGGEWILTQDLESVQGNSEVVAALTSLGYSVTEAPGRGHPAEYSCQPGRKDQGRSSNTSAKNSLPFP